MVEVRETEAVGELWDLHQARMLVALGKILCLAVPSKEGFVLRFIIERCWMLTHAHAS